MIQFLKRAGAFLQVLSDDGSALSLTNIALMVVLVKIAMASQPSVADLGAFFVAVLNYAHRRYTGAGDVPVPVAEVVANVESVLGGSK